MSDIDPRDCPHEGAIVEAYIGDPGGDDPDTRGVPWEVMAPEQRDLDSIRSYVALGVCPVCSSRVVSVRSWDPTIWTPDHGPAWTSRWTRLVRDGDS